jgi:hypothetical protein
MTSFPEGDGMAIHFDNEVYGPGYWGVIYMFHHLGTVGYVSPDTITVNGTINVIGDTLNVTYFGDTYPFVVTDFDNAGAIVLSFSDNLYVLSNTPLTEGQVLSLSMDGPGDYVPPPCFAAGTRVLTRNGEVAVERLQVGDEAVALLGGGLSRVRWIGKRRVACETAKHPAALWPLRVRAHAFGPGRPHRDLMLSPDHAVHVDGVLIPVRYLENGTTVVREPCRAVTYYHVELERHDLLLSEGLATESYLDTGNRDDFVGEHRDPAQAEAEAAAARQVWAERGCAPLCLDGPVLARARARLAARATALGREEGENPGLRLVVGRFEHAPRREGDTWHFELPGLTAQARLVSHGFVPAERGLDARDGRCLGVAVRRLLVDGRAVPLHSPALGRGWHTPEHGLRWTAGWAELPPLRRLSVMLAPIGRTQASSHAPQLAQAA